MVLYVLGKVFREIGLLYAELIAKVWFSQTSADCSPLKSGLCD